MPDPTTFASVGWTLLSIAALCAALNQGRTFMAGFKESPPPNLTYVTKHECAATHLNNTREVVELKATVARLEVERDSLRRENLSAIDALRLETKADIAAIHRDLRGVSDGVNSLAGEMKHVNTSLISLGQQIQGLA